MVVSYFVGRHYYPLPYQLKRIALYTVTAVALYMVGDWITAVSPTWVAYSIKSILLVAYCGLVAAFEEIPLVSPLLRRFFRR